ncbi:MAG: hypothetical protein Q9166_002822 [cf. Caloplaca sp. 2 TL-2023]
MKSHSFSIVLLALLFSNISTSLAVPNPLKAAATSLNAVLPTESLTELFEGILPKPPPGFRTRITTTDTRPLNPVSVYLVAIGYLYVHYHDLWNGLTIVQAPISDPATMGVNNDVTGRYIDPFHPDFSITYNYGATRLQASDIFTALFKALIIVAHDGGYRPFNFLNAARTQQSSGATVATFLEILSRMIVGKKMMQEVEFAFEEREGGRGWRRVAVGFFFGMQGRRVPGGGGQITTS